MFFFNFVSYGTDNYNNDDDDDNRYYLIIHLLLLLDGLEVVWITHLNLNLTSFSLQSTYIGALVNYVRISQPIERRLSSEITPRRSDGVNDHRRAYLPTWRNKTGIGNVKMSARRPIAVDDTPMKPPRPLRRHASVTFDVPSRPCHCIRCGWDRNPLVTSTHPSANYRSRQTLKLARLTLSECTHYLHLSVCLCVSVCNALTFESIDLGCSFLVCRCTSECSVYVRTSRSSGQDQSLRSKNAFAGGPPLIER